MCPELLELDLISNPVSYLENYRIEVKKLVPNLILLDGRPFNSPSNDGSSDIGNTSSEFGSLSDQTRSEISSNNDIITVNYDVKRPSSFANITACENKTIRINRPSTADPVNSSTNTSLSSGEPVCGNVISRIRLNRKNKKSAWVASDTSSSISSSDSISTKDFPEVIPQQSFDLELGVLGMVAYHTASNHLTEDDDHAKLLLAAKSWRMNRNLSESNL
ncbi:hypothetical protein Bhyg_02637 [Pseudolycoriella hygida]|uniref:Uncharacterized protein n=1 Tax=Pseudolycoriella hygida TaxID=35572 RepID=A0A9Q0NBT3_9DIPT|nr:hypothetical protein Bhyg_02637 [Pseudolycoriella hygida]